MKMRYNKDAILQYIEQIQKVKKTLKAEQDDSMLRFSLCRQKYNRLHGELEQKCRKSYNRVEDAESKKRSDEALLQRYKESFDNAESEQSKAILQNQIRIASDQLLEDNDDLSSAQEQYRNDEKALHSLEELWNRYYQQLESTSRRMEDRLFELLSIVKKEDQALSKYMIAMQRVEDELKKAHPSDNGDLQNSQVESLQKESIAASSLLENIGGTEDKQHDNVYFGASDNLFGLMTIQGLTSIVIVLNGQVHSFPNTKSGAAKAYRIALKSHDPEIIEKTQTAFNAGGVPENVTLLPNQQYIVETMLKMQSDLPTTFDKEMVLAGAELQQLRSPKRITPDGVAKGIWKGNAFYLDDDYVPTYKNERQLTIAEIRQELYDSFQIELKGIPFVDGVADFRSISIANISTKDIVMRATGLSSQEYDRLEAMERTKIYSEVFREERRNANFAIADQLVAERQLPILGLSDGYTATDVKRLRTDPQHRFTWDEQVSAGYNLVPTIIHGNVPHTGLVSSSSTAVEYFDKREHASPQEFSLDESDAPTTVNEFLDKTSLD